MADRFPGLPEGDFNMRKKISVRVRRLLNLIIAKYFDSSLPQRSIICLVVAFLQNMWISEPEPKRDNPYLDRHYSGYHKNHIQKIVYNWQPRA